MASNWLESHRGETVVVKFGGNAMIDDELMLAFCQDVVQLQRAGIRIVVTHGGGPQISSELVARGIHSEFRTGLRVTTLEAVLVVRDVLVRVGSGLAARIHSAGGQASALAGDADGLLAARKMTISVDDVLVDLGHVGEVARVDTAAIDAIVNAGGIPVVSSIARDEESGELLNVNADAAAASMAVALGAHWLLLLTDVAGLYRDWPNRQSLVRRIDTDELDELIPRLESGMIPKIAAARSAVLGGVGHAVIMDGRLPHVLVAEPFGDSGTMVTPMERNTHE